MSKATTKKPSAEDKMKNIVRQRKVVRELFYEEATLAQELKEVRAKLKQEELGLGCLIDEVEKGLPMFNKKVTAADAAENND